MSDDLVSHMQDPANAKDELFVEWMDARQDIPASESPLLAESILRKLADQHDLPDGGAYLAVYPLAACIDGWVTLTDEESAYLLSLGWPKA